MVPDLRIMRPFGALSVALCWTCERPARNTHTNIRADDDADTMKRCCHYFDADDALCGALCDNLDDD